MNPEPTPANSPTDPQALDAEVVRRASGGRAAVPRLMLDVRDGADLTVRLVSLKALARMTEPIAQEALARIARLPATNRNTRIFECLAAGRTSMAGVWSADEWRRYLSERGTAHGEDVTVDMATDSHLMESKPYVVDDSLVLKTGEELSAMSLKGLQEYLGVVRSAWLATKQSRGERDAETVALKRHYLALVDQVQAYGTTRALSQALTELGAMRSEYASMRATRVAKQLKHRPDAAPEGRRHEEADTEERLRGFQAFFDERDKELRSKPRGAGNEDNSWRDGLPDLGR